VEKPPRLTQRLILRILPKRLEERAIRESKEWHFICDTCGRATSFWDTGGIRMGAYSKGKRMLFRCQACGKQRWHRVERWTDPPANPPG
jgi:hypothetical protein